MSFSAETKNELTRIDSDDQAVNLAELAGIVRLSGSIQIAGLKDESKDNNRAQLDSKKSV